MSRDLLLLLQIDGIDISLVSSGLPYGNQIAFMICTADDELLYDTGYNSWNVPGPFNRSVQPQANMEGQCVRGTCKVATAKTHQGIPVRAMLDPCGLQAASQGKDALPMA